MDSEINHLICDTAATFKKLSYSLIEQNRNLCKGYNNFDIYFSNPFKIITCI